MRYRAERAQKGHVAVRLDNSNTEIVPKMRTGLQSDVLLAKTVASAGGRTRKSGVKDAEGLGEQQKKRAAERATGQSRGRRAGHLLARSLSASLLLLRPPDQGETSHQNSSTSLLRVVAYCDRACHPRTDRDTASLSGACFVHSIRYPTTTCCDFSRRRPRPRAPLSAIANDVPLRLDVSATRRDLELHTRRPQTPLYPRVWDPLPKSRKTASAQHFRRTGHACKHAEPRQQLPDSARIPVARGLAAPRPFPTAPSP